MTKTIEAATRHGRVRGINGSGIFTFRGIPYAASTAGKARFLPPKSPKSWSGVRDALDFGAINYQFPPERSPATDISAYDWKTVAAEYWVALKGGNPFAVSGDGSKNIYEGEDCLALNVWTQGINDKKDRPVMVWIHGGAFRSGHGAISGEGLAKTQDVVVVSINHRLNLFGHLHLAALGGEKYIDSGNVGLLDMVAALEWVRDNIAEFGGNPDNVTIFGESGGGTKISALLATPAAQGLFHKAIMQSGPGIHMNTPEFAADFSEQFMHHLGLKPHQVDALHTIPAEKLISVANSFELSRHWRTYQPVVDGRTLLAHPFDPVAPEMSADVPLMMGCTEYEQTCQAHISGFPDEYSRKAELPEGEMLTALKEFLETDEETARSYVAAHRQNRPDASAYDTYFWITSAYFFRAPTLETVDKKADLKRAPVYHYQFEWQTPFLGGVLRSPHAIELPFVFNAFEKPLASVIPKGAETQKLADQMSTAWASFARTGNPNHGVLPHWPAYDTVSRHTMIFDTECRVKSDPDGAEIRALMSLPSYPVF